MATTPDIVSSTPPGCCHPQFSSWFGGDFDYHRRLPARLPGQRRIVTVWLRLRRRASALGLVHSHGARTHHRLTAHAGRGTNGRRIIKTNTVNAERSTSALMGDPTLPHGHVVAPPSGISLTANASNVIWLGMPQAMPCWVMLSSWRPNHRRDPFVRLKHVL